MSDDKETKDILKDILKWTRFEGMEKFRTVFDTALNTDSKKIVYEFSDGRSSPEIEQITGIDDSTIRDYWKEWAFLGLVELHPEYKKRYRRVFSLKEFGIEIPKVKTNTQTKENSKTKEDVNEGDKNE